MFGKKVIEPVRMTEDEKLKWLANAGVGSIFPTAFAGDNELMLISLLARRIYALEARVERLERNA